PTATESEISENVPAPTVDIVRPSDVVPGAIPTVEDRAAEFGGVFVDPTDYAVGATENAESPDVVISERSTGCEYEVNDKNLTAGCGADQSVAKTPSAPEGINIGPVNISRSGVRFTGSVATVASREYYNTVAKPLVELQAGESFVFPLASASPITSLFGWRWHPIHGDYRFHSGTDVGAPQGTPILATQSGQVSVADYLGGYGLTVILRHNDNTLESRYAHMSHMLVQPGEWVEQGDVIGLVGSTGNSTGPHLHFELHQLTGQGWVTVNPNDVLRYALANLNNRGNDNPLVALNIMPKAEAAPVKAALPTDLKTETLVKDAPNFRPAQPHAQ
ncbi:MAG: M23 family metallopeptidase, partial [Cyanobacteria bacterium P01_D01_bin.2]